MPDRGRRGLARARRVGPAPDGSRSVSLRVHARPLPALPSTSTSGAKQTPSTVQGGRERAWGSSRFNTLRGDGSRIAGRIVGNAERCVRAGAFRLFADRPLSRRSGEALSPLGKLLSRAGLGFNRPDCIHAGCDDPLWLQKGTRSRKNLSSCAFLRLFVAIRVWSISGRPAAMISS